MRTRFLATDYAVAGVSPVETLDFAHLPLPHFPPPNYPSFSENFELSFDEIPVFGISHEVEKLPIDDALSIFLSDVLPHFVDCAGFEEPRISISNEKSEVISLEVKHGSTSSEKGGNGCKFVQFEIPEVDISMLPSGSAVHSQIECLDIFSEIPDAELTVDLLNSELAVHDHPEIQQSIYSVDDISVKCLMEQKADFLEDPDSVEGKFHSNNIRFPLFEVDVESLGVCGRIYTMDELLSLETIEKQQVSQPNEVISNKKDLLGSLEFDLIKYLLNPCVETECLEDKKVSLPVDPCVETECLEDKKVSLPVDFISVVELSRCQEYSTLHHDRPYGDTILSTEQLLFDEILFFDLDPYNFIEVISDSAKEVEAETCESMFGEAMHFRSFSNLIVCHELTLMDDTFKSLPVPIFSDHRDTNSLHTLVEELLAQLDWQSSSASDGLYLDWHFLGEDDCESAKYSSCWKMLGEIDTYNIDVTMISSDSGKLIFEFILSEGYSNKPNAEKCQEILNLPSNDAAVFNSSGRADLSRSSNHGDGIRTNDEASLKTCVEKVQMFGESMSSDLQFFLNPRNYVTQKESILADKLVDTDTVSQVLASSDDFSAANATTGVQQKWDVKMHQKNDLGSGSAHKESKTKLEELLNTIPVKETYGNEPEAVNKEESCIRVQSVPVGSESKQHLSCKSLFPNVVIIVNTQNLNEEMVISRRSTYQRILEMEQEGVQVVERDIGLPVDLIVSSAVCLTWYNCRNIRKKASAPDEAFSCLPLCVESIAASILTSLSFAVSCCILVFEGESNFLCSIMESSDEIYAAGASLGIDIQLFLSYSSEMTEEIILSCINVAAELSRGLYPKMADSESLAESFLTAFPSINPLSAHAILSSDAILGKFLELPIGDRVFALQKYQVPEESIALLSAISRYGEREDSRSGMTDCSSSVSIPDSENSQFKSACERKKPKYTHKPYNAGEPPNDLFHTKSLKLLPDDQLNLPKLSASRNSWLSGNAVVAHELEQFSLSLDDNFFGQSQDIDDDMIKKSIDKSSLYDLPLSKGLHISDESEKSWMPRIGIDCSPRRKSATMAKNKFSRQSINLSGKLHENFAGEIIDVDDTEDFKEIFSLPNSSSFSPILLDIEKDNTARNSSRSTRPLSTTNLPKFTNPVDIDAYGAWVSRNDERGKVRPHFDTTRRTIPMTSHRVLVEDDIIEKAPQGSCKLSFQEKGTRKFGGTPLSDALHSTQPQQGSPWTIEFLNRIREKSRLRRQSVSSDLPSPCLGSLGNTSKVTKRKSPSILEFYKYKGGSSSTPQKTAEQKRLKRSPQPSNSLKNKKASTSFPSSWTPIDKRARRKLSFSTNESGGQSKLIWRDNSSHATQRRL